MGQIADLETVAQYVAKARANGATIVLTNGAFDLLHVGHLRYLRGAKEYGDILVVAINSDASVRRLKGEDRPVVREDERAELVAALECVDFVTLFDESTVVGVIEKLRPDVHVKGTDYTPDTIPEADVVRGYGGRVAVAGDPKNHSTSATIARLLR